MTDKIILRRDEETGIVEAFSGEEKVGEVISMGDQMNKEGNDEDSV